MAHSPALGSSALTPNPSSVTSGQLPTSSSVNSWWQHYLSFQGLRGLRGNAWKLMAQGLAVGSAQQRWLLIVTSKVNRRTWRLAINRQATGSKVFLTSAVMEDQLQTRDRISTWYVLGKCAFAKKSSGELFTYHLYSFVWFSYVKMVSLEIKSNFQRFKKTMVGATGVFTPCWQHHIHTSALESWCVSWHCAGRARQHLDMHPNGILVHGLIKRHLLIMLTQQQSW